MPVIGINFDITENGKTVYKSVYVHWSDTKKENIFNSGNFVEDWVQAISLILESETSFLLSSSVNDFLVMNDVDYELFEAILL